LIRLYEATSGDRHIMGGSSSSMNQYIEGNSFTNLEIDTNVPNQVPLDSPYETSSSSEPSSPHLGSEFRYKMQVFDGSRDTTLAKTFVQIDEDGVDLLPRFPSGFPSQGSRINFSNIKSLTSMTRGPRGHKLDHVILILREPVNFKDITGQSSGSGKRLHFVLYKKQMAGETFSNFLREKKEIWETRTAMEDMTPKKQKFVDAQYWKSMPEAYMKRYQSLQKEKESTEQELESLRAEFGSCDGTGSGDVAEREATLKNIQGELALMDLKKSLKLQHGAQSPAPCHNVVRSGIVASSFDRSGSMVA